MTALRPYLIRAVHDWILDNGWTPHVLVDAERDGVRVPPQYVQEGRIVLNLRPEAVQSLSLGDESLSFRARFGGVPTQMDIPVAAVLALYARENGRGMVFQAEGGDEDLPTPPEDGGDASASSPPRPGRPRLSVVK